jgi:hypothetical protein
MLEYVQQPGLGLRLQLSIGSERGQDLKTSGKALRILDVVTTVATLCAACALLAVIWVQYGPGARRAASGPSRITAGTHAPIDGVDWKDSQSTVVLVLSTQCHFCVESTPFYQQISRRREPNVLRVVAVFNEDIGAARSYLSQHAIPVDEVLRQSPEKTGIRGTPALLLVDAAGTVTKAWHGKVAAATEKEILDRLSPRS